MKILVLGASGMAGHIMYNKLKELGKYEVIATTNQHSIEDNTLKMNIFDSANVESVIKNTNPDIVINCIGMLIQTSKRHPEQTIYGNAYFPHFLKKLADDYHFKLIHISTDCVFSGKDGQYTETSLKDATDVYGLSKNLGEIIDEKNLTIRTSIIGPEIKTNGEGLFHWFMTQNEPEINGYKSNYWSGVTTIELANFVIFALVNSSISGLVHLTNNEKISKFDLLHLFKNEFNKNVVIKSDKDYACDKSFLNTNDDIQYQVPSYKAMIAEMHHYMKAHHHKYEQYL